MIRVVIVMTTLIFLVACSQEEQPGVAQDSNDSERTELTVMTHDSFSISESLLNDFEDAHNAKIVLLPSGDAGVALSQAILSKDNPLADVFFGVDNTYLSRALDADIFEPFDSPLLGSIPDSFELDPSKRLLPLDYGDVCLNYDIDWLERENLEPPNSLLDLTEPQLRGLTVVENPATSSPGLAFLMATISQFGTEGAFNYLDFWRELRANDVLVTDGWEEAYYGQFSAASDGTRPIVVSYASSPPAEIVFADPPIDEPPTAAVVDPGTCFRQIEFIGILKMTEHRQLAEAFINYALDVPFQEDIPLNMFVFPTNEMAKLPEVFLKWAAIPMEPAGLAPEQIEANREVWIENWTDSVLR